MMLMIDIMMMMDFVWKVLTLVLVIAVIWSIIKTTNWFTWFISKITKLLTED